MQKVSPLRSSDSGLGAARILRRYEGAMVRPTLTPFHPVLPVLLFSGARPDCAQKKSDRQSFPRHQQIAKRDSGIILRGLTLLNVDERELSTPFWAHMGWGDGGHAEWQRRNKQKQRDTLEGKLA
jgi:hypothetical protein